MTPQRPGAVGSAATLAAAGALLLLASVVLLIVRVVSTDAGSTADRWSTAVGAVLTCALAGAGLMGAVSLLRGTGRTLLRTAAWVQVGVLGTALVSVVAALVTGSTSAGTGLVVLAVCGGALALAAATLRMSQRPEVLGWLGASESWRAVVPGRPGPGLVLAAPAPALLLAVGAVIAVAVQAAPSSGPGVQLGPVAPPPAASEPGWSPEFAPEADGCAAGSMSACDDLYWESTVGDAYERYGSTCGGRLSREVAGGCVALLGRTLN